MKHIYTLGTTLIILNLLIWGFQISHTKAQTKNSTPAQMTSQTNLLLNTDESISTLQDFSVNIPLIQAGDEEFIRYESNGEHHLLLTLDLTSASLVHRLDKQSVSLNQVYIANSTLAGNGILYIGLDAGSTLVDIFRYDGETKQTQKVYEASSEIGLLSYSEETQSVYWSESSEETTTVYQCQVNDCSPSTLFSIESGADELLSDQKSVVLSSANTFSICSDSCETPQSIQRSSEIIRPHLEFPYLSWSERREGITEVHFLDVRSPQEIFQLTSNSSGDQLNPHITVSEDKMWYISWENYSGIEEITSIASLISSQLITQRNIPSPGRFPQIENGDEETCFQSHTLSSWNTTQKELLESNAQPQQTEFISNVIPLDELSYNTTLILEGELNPASLKAFWRASEEFNWKPAIISEDSPTSITLQTPHKQFQIRITLEDEQCLSSVSINTDPTPPSTNGANSTLFTPSEYESTLPLNLGNTLTTEEIDLDDEVYQKLNTLIDTEEVNKALNTGPDTDRDGLSDSYEAVLKTDPNNPDTDAGGLSDGTEQLVHKLDPLNPADDDDVAVKVSNIQPRSTLPVLSIITGFAPQAEKNVWFYLVDDRKTSIEIGSTQPREDGSFIFRAPPVPESYKGEVVLIASQVPDIRLAPLFPKLTHSLSIYLYNEEDILAKRKIIELALEIESLQFSQNGIPLKTLQTDFREVYYPDESSPIDIAITGRIYGESLSTVNVFSTLLPTLQQKTHEKSGENQSLFDIELQLDPYPQDIPIDISIQATDDKKNMSTTQTLSFNTRPREKYPNNISDIMSYISQQQEIIALAALFIILLFFYILCLKTDRDVSGQLSFLLIITTLFGLTYSITSSSLYILHKNGHLEIAGQQQEVQKIREISPSSLTLLKKDENLNVVAHLAKSWSNVSDLTWEFRLRKHVRANDQSFIKSEDIIRTLQEKIADHSPEQQYLASIDQIIHINDQVFQIVTQFPDPLLPQKLTKITLLSSETPDDDNLNGLLYIPLETHADHKRSKVNPWFFDYPFTTTSSTYINESYSMNPQSFLNRIKNRELDIIDEPAQELWPALKDNDYLVVAKVSTESFILLANRNSFFLESDETIRYLQNIIHHESLLEAFPNESSLSKQFIPPGVVGYNSELALAESTTAEAPSETLTLKLNYPVRNSPLARLVESRFQQFGINIIPVEFSSTEFKQALLSNLPDLILLPLNFELADAGPFLDTFIDSSSPFNTYYKNERVDQLILESRYELDQFERLQILKEIMTIIVTEDPAGIPLINRKKFQAIKDPSKLNLLDRWIKSTVRSHYERQNPLDYINPYRE